MPLPGGPGARLFGVVHLAPLPLSPRFAGSRAAVRDAARRDAGALLEGGCDGFVVENLGDAPFRRDRVEPAVVAEMTCIVARLVELAGPGAAVGVNVLRNDAGAALAIAAAAGARFIRVNVHTGVMLADQGAIEGRADRTLRLRRALACEVAIVADVWVKHAVPPPGATIAEAARDTAYRGLADALVVTGAETGRPPARERLAAVREAVPDRPLLVGSGVTPANAPGLLELADGAIVGTSLREAGDLGRPVDPARVAALVRAARG